MGGFVFSHYHHLWHAFLNMCHFFLGHSKGIHHGRNLRVFSTVHPLIDSKHNSSVFSTKSDTLNIFVGIRPGKNRPIADTPGRRNIVNNVEGGTFSW